MEINKEEAAPQNPAGGAGNALPPEPTVTLSKKEYDDLAFRAGASSQNFERLKKAEEDLVEARRLQSANNSPTPDPALTKTISDLQATVTSLTSEATKAKLVSEYPVLKDSWADFEKFKQDPANAGMPEAAAAKVFLSDKGLLDQRRPGIERPTGGPRVPQTTGMSAEQVAHLRTTDYRKYSQMLKDGQIQISE